jgi:hypothetical protein
MTLPAGVVGFGLLQTLLFAQPIPRDVVFLLNLFSSRLAYFRSPTGISFEPFPLVQ